CRGERPNRKRPRALDPERAGSGQAPQRGARAVVMDAVDDQTPLEIMRHARPAAVADLLRRKTMGEEGFANLPLELLVTPYSLENGWDLDGLADLLAGCGTADHVEYLSPSWARVPFVLGAVKGSMVGPGSFRGWVAYL